MSVTDISSRLSSLADSKCIVSNPIQLASYQIDGVTPSAALRPASVEQIVEIVKFAAAEKLAIIPRGARTKFGMIPRPQRYDLALDMTALDRIVAYDPADLTLSVESGVPLHRLAGVLAGHRQFLPLQVPFFDRATVGGTIASGIDSPLRQLYGTARDFVLGMEFVTAAGRIAKSGGRVVKNVSGYDLHKLMIGACGTLGVISKINFRTFPTPATTHAFIAFFETVNRAAEMSRRIAESPLRPLNVEIVNPAAVALLFSAPGAQMPRAVAGEFPPRDQWALIIGFSGIAKVIDRYERELRGMAGDTDAISLDEEAAPPVLARLSEFVSIALGAWPEIVILKAGMLPNQLSPFLRNVTSISEAASLQLAVVARGVGVVYFALQPDPRSIAALPQVIENIFQASGQRGGHAEIFWRPRMLREMPASLNPKRPDFAQMRNLKKTFDPENIFAPDAFSRWIPDAR